MFARSVMVLGQLSELSHSAQVLYMTLNMLADDDGFVGNAKVIVRQCRCTGKHLKSLLDAGFLLQFPNGPIVIAHWLVHNQLRKDRYKPTLYQAEYEQLLIEKNEPYRFRQPEETGCQKVDLLATQDRLGKDREGEVRKGKKNTGDQAGSPEAGSSSSHGDFEKMVLDAYKTHCTQLADCSYLDADTGANIRDLEKKGWTAERLEKAFRTAGECAFLRGENDRGWKADLRWLTQEDNLRKVCAGKYETYQKQEKVPYGAGQLGEVELEEVRRLLGESREG